VKENTLAFGLRKKAFSYSLLSSGEYPPYCHLLSFLFFFIGDHSSQIKTESSSLPSSGGSINISSVFRAFTTVFGTFNVHHTWLSCLSGSGFHGASFWNILLCVIDPFHTYII
jgi:hypothetical protein